MNLKTSFKKVFIGCVCVAMLLFVPFQGMSSTSFAITLEQISHAPKDAQVSILSPQDGATVSRTFSVKFGLTGMDLAPAGVDQENTGHHHLLIDQPEINDFTASLPATEQIRHFGKAQTETELTLEPGEHTLQLILGNYLHIPHDNPVISQPITVEVK